LENRPGIWVLDFETGVTLLMFSDGHRKHSIKGCSFEVVINDALWDRALASALRELTVLFDGAME